MTSRYVHAFYLIVSLLRSRAAYAYQQSQVLLNGTEDVWKWIAVIQEENAYRI